VSALVSRKRRSAEGTDAGQLRVAAERRLNGAVTHKEKAFKIELAKRTMVRELTTCPRGMTQIHVQKESSS